LLFIRVLSQDPQHVRRIKKECPAETVVKCQSCVVGADDGGVPSGNKADVDNTRTLQVPFFSARCYCCKCRWRDEAGWYVRLAEVEELDVASCMTRCDKGVIVRERDGGHRTNGLF
jgi:hypothetical protein